MNIFKPFFDLIFPPLCLSCSERCDTRYLCPTCWQLCAPPDPAERCRHCFAEMIEEREFCADCRHTPRLPIPRAFVFDEEAPIVWIKNHTIEAIVGFTIHQWLRLDWPSPYAVVPMPNRESKAVAKLFAKWLGCPYIQPFRSFGYELKPNRLPEDRDLLLIDARNSMERIERGIKVLSEAFPKRLFLLTLYPCYSRF